MDIKYSFASFYALLILILPSCQDSTESTSDSSPSEETTEPDENLKASIIVLGTVQDAGAPQAGCDKECCSQLFENPDKNKKVVSIGVVDHQDEKKYIFDATPDIASQLKKLKNHGGSSSGEAPDGIFLTHAHIGHYVGLMFLGREAMSTKNVPVYVMPRMKSFLENNGPWDMLVKSENIILKSLTAGMEVNVSSNIKVEPFLVPHRDEYSETVGYKIIGPEKTAIFIPDIDKWGMWEKDIVEEIRKVDYALLDATFYSGEEIDREDISEIPHPFVIESLEKFAELSEEERKKVYFIHFNHTNPLLDSKSAEYQEVIKNGFKIASIYDVIDL